MATRQRKCHRCGGKGDIRCPKCHGTGLVGNKEACFACLSAFSIIPVIGTGRVKCESCDGKGYIEDDYDDERHSRRYDKDDYRSSYSSS